MTAVKVADLAPKEAGTCHAGCCQLAPKMKHVFRPMFSVQLCGHHQREECHAPCQQIHATSLISEGPLIGLQGQIFERARSAVPNCSTWGSTQLAAPDKSCGSIATGLDSKAEKIIRSDPFKLNKWEAPLQTCRPCMEKAEGCWAIDKKRKWAAKHA